MSSEISQFTLPALSRMVTKNPAPPGIWLPLKVLSRLEASAGTANIHAVVLQAYCTGESLFAGGGLLKCIFLRYSDSVDLDGALSDFPSKHHLLILPLGCTWRNTDWYPGRLCSTISETARREKDPFVHSFTAHLSSPCRMPVQWAPSFAKWRSSSSCSGAR